MYNKIKYILVLICSLMAVATHATHVAGGSMTYRCIGPDTYEVSLEFRRDCFNGADNAQFDDFASVGVFNDDNQLVLTVGQFGEIRIPFIEDDTLNEILTSECNVIGGDVCLQTTVYRDTVILPSIPGGYILAYQRCCYNATLNNVANPLNTGATIWIKITEAALEICNSSPVFIKSPSVYICANDTLRFDHSAEDIDGDSLVYFMCASSAGADAAFPQPRPPNAPPYLPVTYAAGFSENNMMGGSPISVDPVTGQLIAVPSEVGQFLIGVCVREFRNGELLSEVRRDFEYNVRVCGRNPIAMITPEFVTQCNSLEVEFSNNSTSNFLPVDSLDFLWLFDFPNTNLSSTEMSPTYTFPTPGLYNVAMIVTDGVCTDTTFADIGVSVEGDPTANFDVSSYDCDGTTEIQLTDLSTSSQELEYQWIISYANGADTSNLQNPVIDIGTDQPITVSLQLSTPSRCLDSLIIRDIEIMTVPLRADFVDKIICNGEDALIFSSNIDSLNVTIFPDAGVMINAQGEYIFQNFVGRQDFIVNVDDGFCFLMDTVTINATSNPQFPIADIIQCGDETVELNPTGPDFYTYNWEGPQGVSIISNEPNPLVSLTQDAEFYVTVSTSPGSLCFFTDTVSVVVRDNPTFSVLPSSQIVYCEGTDISISLDSDFPSILWVDTATGIVVGVGQEITLSNLLVSTMLEVTVEDDFGCATTEIIDIQFVGAPDFTFDTTSDFNVCVGESASLIATSLDVVQWFDSSGNLLASGTNFTLANVTMTTNVTAVATNDLGCQSTQQITVGVFQNPDIDFTPLEDVSICENQIFTLSLLTSDNVEWSFLNGDVIGNGSTIIIENIITDTSLVATVTNQFGCTTAEIFQVDVDPMIIPEIDLSPLDAVSTCTGNGIELVLDDDYEFVFTDIDGNLLSDTNVLTLDNLTEPELIVVTVLDNRNCSLMDTFMIEIFDDIGLSIEGGIDSLTYCQRSAIDINSSFDVNASVEWYILGGGIIGNGVILSQYMPVGNQTIVAIAMDMFGCMDTDTITLVESIIDGEISGDGMICLGESTTITVSPASNLDFELSWTPDVAILSETDNSITVQPSQTTTYTVVYINSDGCETEYIFEVQVDGFFDGVNAFATPDEILFGQSTTLSTDQNDNFGYIWSPAESLDNATDSDPEATPDETITYTVTVTEDNGCTDTATIEVTVIQPNCDESDIYVPNMFTPNGDMLNDTWRIESNFIDRFDLVVYDRWGEEVFTSMDQDVEWDGTFRNKELEPDVYGYYLMAICTNGFEYSKQGNVTIVK